MHKKYHPPSKKDEVWRLEGIGKDGIYHKNLSSHGINNVGDFLKAYLESNDPTSLKKVSLKREKNQNPFRTSTFISKTQFIIGSFLNIWINCCIQFFVVAW